MEQEVASSAPRVPDRPDSGTAVVHAVQQHTPVQASRTPSRAAPTRCLWPESCYATPSSTASPGAMKQWRDDVDRLLGMAHSTSTRSRPRSSQRQREATASVRSPSVRGAQTDDLRAELNRRLREKTPRSLWKGRMSADRTSRVATSTEISLRRHRRHQWAPGPKQVSP
jgi:hypothetical protein